MNEQDHNLVGEIWQAFPRSKGGAFDTVVGLLRGRQWHSYRDPAWWPTGGHHANTGVLTLGNLRCAGSTRLRAAVVLTAHALGELCPAPVRAMATRLLAEGLAGPVQGDLP